MAKKYLRDELRENWGIDQETGVWRWSRKEEVDGAIRFALSDDDDVPEIQAYSEGIWEPTEMRIAYGTLFLGHNMALSSAGDQFITENVDGSKRHLYARALFSGADGTEELRVAHLNPVTYHLVAISDDSGEFIGTSFSYSVPPLFFSFLNTRFYLKIGSIDAAAGVYVNIHRGPDTTYPKRFSQIYSAATFSVKNASISVADSPDNPGTARFTLGDSDEMWVGQEITTSGFTVNTDYNVTEDEITATGVLSNQRWFEISTVSYGSDETGSFFTREIVIDMSDFYDAHDGEWSTFEYASSAPFSLRMDSTNTFPWLATDEYFAYHDEALITKEWLQWDSTALHDWYISHADRKIYVANEAHTKGATFVAESEKWNELSPFIFSWETLPDTQNLLIPENHQMSVHGTFAMAGDLHLQGTLVIRD